MVNGKLRLATLAGVIIISGLILAMGNAGVFLKLDSFNLVLIGVFTALAVTQILTLPNAQLSPSMMTSVFTLQAGTLMVYASDSMTSLILGWILSAWPMIWTRD